MPQVLPAVAFAAFNGGVPLVASIAILGIGVAGVVAAHRSINGDFGRRFLCDRQADGAADAEAEQWITRIQAADAGAVLHLWLRRRFPDRCCCWKRDADRAEPVQDHGVRLAGD